MKINPMPKPDLDQLKIYENIIRNYTTIIPNNILEIGGLTGDDSYFLSNLFNIDAANVFIIEAHPEAQKYIEEKYPHFKLLKYAICSENKPVTFNCSEAVGSSSILDRNDTFYLTTYTELITVEGITGEKILNDNNLSEIDICQIDVEGIAYETLDSFGQSINKIKSIHIECEHYQIWKNQKLYTDVKEFLEKNNFQQLYFRYINPSASSQSESIWVNKNYLK